MIVLFLAQPLFCRSLVLRVAASVLNEIPAYKSETIVFGATAASKARQIPSLTEPAGTLLHSGDGGEHDPRPIEAAGEGRAPICTQQERNPVRFPSA